MGWWLWCEPMPTIRASCRGVTLCLPPGHLERGPRAHHKASVPVPTSSGCQGSFSSLAFPCPSPWYLLGPWMALGQRWPCQDRRQGCGQGSAPRRLPGLVPTSRKTPKLMELGRENQHEDNVPNHQNPQPPPAAHPNPPSPTPPPPLPQGQGFQLGHCPMALAVAGRRWIPGWM